MNNRHMAYPDADMTPENYAAMPYSGICPDCGEVMWFDAAALVSLEHGGYVRCYGCYEPTPEEIEQGKDAVADWQADQWWRGGE